LIARNRNMFFLMVKVILLTLVIFSFILSSQAKKESMNTTCETATWTDMDMSVPIHPKSGHNSATYDSESDRIILAISESMEVCAYDYNTNSYENLSSPGFKRKGGRMAYDSESDIVIFFGGEYQETEWGPHIFKNDTWAYDYNTDTWTNMTTDMTSSSPPLQGWCNMAYDSESDRIILTGGVDYSDSSPWLEFDETWAYNYNTNTWEQMNPSKCPEPQTYIVYDVESDRIIAFGRISEEGESDETWAYDYNTDTWEQMSPAKKPSTRCSFGIAYDCASDRVILFGGAHRGGYPATLPAHPYSDTWTYDYNTDTWIELDLSVHPVARQSHLMEYDQESDKIVIIGGIARNYDVTTAIYNDTWVLEYLPNYASTPQNLQATSIDSSVNLTWQAPSNNGGSPITGYNIYRGTTSGDLSLLTQLGNVFEYSDTEVTPGTTYYYIIRAVNEVGESSASEEKSITIPELTTTTSESAISFSILLSLFAFIGISFCRRRKLN
jgi:N-acetylneuraminic acid mutarotase